MYTSNNSIIGRYNNNADGINDMYYISIIMFIILMHIEISQITVIIIMVVYFNVCFVLK